MLPAFDTFKDEVMQIEKYIESIRCYNDILTIRVTESEEIKIHKIMDLQKLSNGFNKRKYDYSIIIINLYGCLEQYIESFIKDYLMLLVEHCKKYTELPQNITEKHIDLSVLLIGRIEQSKYSDYLTKEQVIINLNDCIQSNKCNLNYEAFCQHTANFRIQTIADVLKNVGLSNIINDVKRNKELKELYIQNNGACNYENLKPEIVFSFLDELADRRNQIAHGSVTDILSLDLQIEMIRKVCLFVQEMDSLGFENVLPYLANRSYKIDKIFNPNKKTKLLCFYFNGNQIGVDDIVIVRKKDGMFTYCRIESIEIEHKKYQTVIANETNIGIMLSRTRNFGEEYWIYNTVK